MGTIIVGKCQCQCYINYVSCDYTYQEHEIRTERRTNRFAENTEKSINKIKSPGNSTEKLSRFSSTRKPSSRSSSLKSKYLESSECNVDPDESSSTRIKQKPKLNPSFVKSFQSYSFREFSVKPQFTISQQQKTEHQKSTQSTLVSQIKSSNRPLNNKDNMADQYEYRPFKKANKYQQLFFK
ncbi:unnamed protein product (macronuclear) [Paramecium tetraurelia]|uniref:Uncharacterized protein n=1 Tax=Paramecium tetraurelia TaxID=5888 RepID=A0C5R6_PARTE|nr:uncharacterized protein GSPATT00035262001 [Paramecium tetraurelia]CAK66133.1 unnamed protein product [Paramecium tetraurelia]|eukprot:XP_001433530.1 hypothetical protein (macronuclear) [Paramecium tetraurelia strain d4-2]